MLFGYSFFCVRKNSVSRKKMQLIHYNVATNEQVKITFILLSAVSSKLWLQNSKKKNRLYTIYALTKRFIIKHNRTK